MIEAQSVSEVLAGDASWYVAHGSCLDILATMPDNSVDAVVTDPPYGLGKEPDPIALLQAWLAGDVYDPGGGGFMNRRWDSFVPGPHYWREVFRVLKPGGNALVFAGTRTVDLMGLSLRLAGFEIRDSIHWAYGSGFPKSLNVSKAIDAAAGAKRDVVARRTQTVDFDPDATGGGWAAGEIVITVPATDSAKQWNGWGTALKPAHEPIIMARKPLDGTVAANVLKYGTGAINIDGCRIASGQDHKDKCASVVGLDSNRNGSAYGTWEGERVDSWNAQGRWPANVLLTHSWSCSRVGTTDVKANPTWDTPNRECVPTFTGEEVSTVNHGANGLETVDVFECADDCPVRLMDEQSGVSTSRASGYNWADSVQDNPTRVTRNIKSGVHFSDSGGASRFFARFEWDHEIDDVAPFFYIAKAARKERDTGLEEFRALTAAEATHSKDGQARLNSPRTGAGRTGGARNIHPTVKPRKLMQYLCRLVTPPGGIVFDPFTGSGTTGIGATLEGFRFIGCELNDTEKEPFVSLSRTRIRHWSASAKPEVTTQVDDEPEQLELL